MTHQAQTADGPAEAAHPGNPGGRTAVAAHSAVAERRKLRRHSVRCYRPRAKDATRAGTAAARITPVPAPPGAPPVDTLPPPVRMLQRPSESSAPEQPIEETQPTRRRKSLSKSNGKPPT